MRREELRQASDVIGPRVTGKEGKTLPSKGIKQGMKECSPSY
jgi:hypothetical protein